MRQTFSLEGHFVDIQKRIIFPCRMKVKEGRIQEIIEISKAPEIFIMPGFIDAHDSHNIILVGSDDDKMVQAANLVIENKGGLSAVNEKEAKVLPLPIGGLMSGEDGYKITKQYIYLDKMVKDM